MGKLQNGTQLQPAGLEKQMKSLTYSTKIFISCMFRKVGMPGAGEHPNLVLYLYFLLW